jgi:hypothetical protein
LVDGKIASNYKGCLANKEWRLEESTIFKNN